MAAQNDQEGDVDLEAAEMAGLIKDIHAYAISLDGQLQWEDQPRRIRFMIQLDLSSDRQWVSLDGKVGMAGTWVHIHARRSEETFAIELDEQGAQTARIHWSFDELMDPEAALAKLTSMSGLPPVAVSVILGSLKSLPNMMVPMTWAVEGEPVILEQPNKAGILPGILGVSISATSSLTTCLG